MLFRHVQNRAAVTEMLLLGVCGITVAMTVWAMSAHSVATHQFRTPAEGRQVAHAPADDYDPLQQAIDSIGQTVNLEAPIPPQCYTKTDGVSNPCWTCHTLPVDPNFMVDWDLQEEYAFSDFALTNRWSNLFADSGDYDADNDIDVDDYLSYFTCATLPGQPPGDEACLSFDFDADDDIDLVDFGQLQNAFRLSPIDAMSDEAILEYIRQDNYTILMETLENNPDYPGWVPDLDFFQGFDHEGFASDGSGWRALRYKPFLGTFWPTNGSTDDVFIRLPEVFRQNAEGNPSREVYKINLSILEAAVASDPFAPDDAVNRNVEPLDESVAGIDLNGDGEVGGIIETIAALPESYVGGAHDVQVDRNLFPLHTEFYHTVRYIDPDSPSLLSVRMKEARYSKKIMDLDLWGLLWVYEQDFNNREEGVLPEFSGSPLVGLSSDFGWLLQGFIEDAEGRLRLQTEEEHKFCMGCHGAIGVNVDHTFTMPRKLPGAAGWGWQDPRGIPDVPQAGHEDPEILTYFRRVGGGDEFRANDEVLERFFPNGELDEEEVLRAAPGGDQDITFLIAPSYERALQLNKAYAALVREQSFERGRDSVIRPAENVFPFIEDGPTELGEAGLIFMDGVDWLDWSDASIANEYPTGH